MKQYIIKIIVAILISFSFLICRASHNCDVDSLLTSVQEYMQEKPDSAIAVLKSYETIALQNDSTTALYAVMLTKAEYIATDTIISDTLIRKAVKFYNKTVSYESALASYYHGCYYFGRDYNKAAYAFQNSIDYTPEGYDNHKGCAYHALGSCLFAIGSIEEGVKAYKTALKLLDENSSENTYILCKNIKRQLHNMNSVHHANFQFAMFVIFIVILLTSICVAIYLHVKKRYKRKDAIIKSPDDLLEEKLSQGKITFEQTSAYKVIQEIRSLNEKELHERTYIDVKTIEDDILSSFNDAYHILAESNEKLSHQDLMLCLYGYLKISNNVVAFFMKSMPGTIRQRKNRLKEKLPEKVYLTLFPKVV